MKNRICMRLNSDVIDHINSIMKCTGRSTGQTVELFSAILKDYFTNEQITAEGKTRGIIDGRKKKPKK